MPRGEGQADSFDYVLVGGGLQSGLIALALLSRDAGARIAVVEREDTLGGNHTWCFHAADVPPSIAEALDPLVAHRWSGYDVVFPRHRRRVEASYAAVTSARLRDVLTERLRGAPGCELFLGARAVTLGAGEVELSCGRRIEGRLVVDARGPAASQHPQAAGAQVFVGLELSLKRPHRLSRPVLMDASVPQVGGFRFFYALPFSADRLLLEDTYFADEPRLDRDKVRARVLERVRALGLEVARVDREEAGILPMPWAGDLPEAPAPEEPLRAGYRGAWYHPATGYSFPVAAVLAAFVADRSPERARREIGTLTRWHRNQARYCHLLNRLAFAHFAPECRVHVFERFYRLPEATIRRFYALEMTAVDKLRILAGRPPRGMSIRPSRARSGAPRT